MNAKHYLAFRIALLNIHSSLNLMNHCRRGNIYNFSTLQMFTSNINHLRANRATPRTIIDGKFNSFRDKYQPKNKTANNMRLRGLIHSSTNARAATLYLFSVILWVFYSPKCAPSYYCVRTRVSRDYLRCQITYSYIYILSNCRLLRIRAHAELARARDRKYFLAVFIECGTSRSSRPICRLR